MSIHRSLIVAGFLLAQPVAAQDVMFVSPTETLTVGLGHATRCELYARESARISITHAEKTTVPSEEELIQLFLREYWLCVSVVPALLPPDQTIEEWARDIRGILLSDVGKTPAKDDPDDVEWRRQCRAEYSTWDEATGTVVRRGSPERVPCPCMGEIVCAY